MNKFIMSPPYLLTIYDAPGKYKTQEVNTEKEMEKIRAYLDKSKACYTVSCTSFEGKTKDNKPLRISHKTKKSN